MDLSVLIVTQDHAEYIGRCLDSVRETCAAIDSEVIVIDNRSRDRSAQIVRDRFPEAHLTINPTRQGFAANVNQAIGATSGRFLLVLNPDTELRRGASSTLLEYMRAHPTVAIAGPALRFGDGRLQPSCRRFPSWRSAIARRTPLRRLLRSSSLNQRHLMFDCDHSLVQDVDWLLGACLMVRREAIGQVGPLDEGYRLYVEDIDWCYRMRRGGWRVVYVPQAEVLHWHQAFTDDHWLTWRTLTHFHGMAHFIWKHRLRPVFIAAHSSVDGRRKQPPSRGATALETAEGGRAQRGADVELNYGSARERL